MENVIARFRSVFSAYAVLISLGVVAGLAQLAYGLSNQSAIPPYVQELNLTAHIGLIYAAFLVIETVFKSPMGVLGDRFGRRLLIAGGALLSGLTALGMTMTGDLRALLVLRSFDGLAAAAIWPSMVAAMGGCVGPERRTSAMSVLTVSYIAGLALGPLIGGIANDTTDSRLTSFYVVSVLFLITAAVAFFMIPRGSDSCEESASGQPRKGFRLSDLAVGVKSVPDMMLMAFIAFFAIGLLIPIVKLFAMNEMGMTETAYGKIVLPIAMAVAGASILSGRLGDRWGKANSVRLGIAVTAVSMWAVTMINQPWEFAIAGMFLGIGFVIAMPAWLALVSDMAAPWTRGAVIGALGTAQGIGAVLGTYLGSHLYANVGINLLGIEFSSHYTPFVVSAISLSLCFFIALRCVREGDCRRIGMENE